MVRNIALLFSKGERDILHIIIATTTQYFYDTENNITENKLIMSRTVSFYTNSNWGLIKTTSKHNTKNVF